MLAEDLLAPFGVEIPELARADHALGHEPRQHFLAPHRGAGGMGEEGLIEQLIARVCGGELRAQRIDGVQGLQELLVEGEEGFFEAGRAVEDGEDGFIDAGEAEGAGDGFAGGVGEVEGQFRGIAGAVLGAIGGDLDVEVVGGLDVDEAGFADGDASLAIAVGVELEGAGEFGGQVDGDCAAAGFAARMSRVRV